MAEYHKKKEYREKLSKIRLERKKRLGYLNSPETRKKMRMAKLGKPSASRGMKRKPCSLERKKISADLLWEVKTIIGKVGFLSWENRLGVY